MFKNIGISPSVSGDDALLKLLVKYKEKKEPEVRELIVKINLNLVYFLAGKFADRGEPLEELIQVGRIGLVYAIERFDPSRGYKFSTFATPTIIGEIKKHFRDTTWGLKIDRLNKNLFGQIKIMTEKLELTLGHTPSIQELADCLNVSQEAIIAAKKAGAAYNTESLDDIVTDGSSRPKEYSISDFLGYDDPEIENLIRYSPLRQAIEKLDDVHPLYRPIINLYFFEGLSQTEIGKRLGISQAHVGRLMENAILTMRRIISGKRIMASIRQSKNQKSHRKNLDSFEKAWKEKPMTSTLPTENTDGKKPSQEFPILYENALAFLFVEWPKLSDTEPREINFPYIINNSPVKFVEAQLEPILNNLVRQGVIREVTNGFLRGKNQITVGVKSNQLEVHIGHLVFKKDKVVNLDEDFPLSQSTPSEIVNKNALTKQSYEKTQSGANSKKPSVGSPELKILAVSWGLLKDTEYTRIDFESLSKKTGIARSYLSTYFCSLKRNNILVKNPDMDCSFRKGIHRIVRANFKTYTPYMIIGENVKVLQNEIIDLDERFPIQVEEDIEDDRFGKEQSNYLSTNGKENQERIATSIASAVSPSDPSCDHTQNNVFADEDADPIISEGLVEEEVDITLKSTLDKIQVTLDPLYRQKGHLEFKIKTSQETLSALRVANKLLKISDLNNSIKKVEDLLQTLYVELEDVKFQIQFQQKVIMDIIRQTTI